MSSRGCSGTCSFCSIHAWHAQAPASGRLRWRDPEKVSAEMARLYRERGVRVFIFHDDDFIHPDPGKAIERAHAILDRAHREISRPFAFVIKCRPDDVEAALFAYLKKNGLVRVYVGIESHSRQGLRTLHRGVDPATNLRALSILRDLGVYACFNLLLFHPDSTIEEIEENVAFLSAHTDFPFDVARAELYARSPLEARMIREGRALGDFRGYDYRIADGRAEIVFRLFARLLWERHFGGSSILHLSQDLGYRDSLLGRLEPGIASSELSGRIRGLIREVNEDTIRHLRDLIAFASARGFAPSCLVEPPLAKARGDISECVLARRREWRGLSLEIETRARLARLGLDRVAGLREIPAILGRVALAAPSAALALSALSCGESTTVCDPPPPPHQYTRDIEPRLTRECASSSCHSTDAAAGGLVLASGSGRGNMVGVPSAELPSMPRVRPGKPDSSYVIHKMAGTQASVGGSGDRMPPGTGVDQDLLARLRLWIEEGAPDD